MRLSAVSLVSGFRHLFLPLVGALLLAACSGEGEQQKETAWKTSTLASTASVASAQAKAQPIPRGSGFDFYVLSLSWSPSWCIENDPSGRTEQCAAKNNHGFIVHGLWPQNEQGYPEFCRTRESDRVPEALGRSLFDIMPSMGLIGHEWRKHGSCSGLSQRDYFAVLRAAREKVTIPPQLQSVETPQRTSAAEIETALSAATPGLRDDAFAVTCADGRVDEVRICFNKDLSFRTCSEIDRGGCRLKNLSLPPIP